MKKEWRQYLDKVIPCMKKQIYDNFPLSDEQCEMLIEKVDKITKNADKTGDGAEVRKVLFDMMEEYDRKERKYRDLIKSNNRKE